MPLNDPRSQDGKRLTPTSDFNIKTNRALHNRMSKYDLTRDESAQVWGFERQKDDALAKNQETFKKEYGQRVAAEEIKLAKEQPLRPDGPRPIGGRTPTHKVRAARNVSNNHSKSQAAIRKDYGQKIDNVFQNAHDQGRGPKPEQNRTQTQNRSQTVTQEFNRNAR